MKLLIKKLRMKVLVFLVCVAALSFGLTFAQTSSSDVVLYAGSATVRSGLWGIVSDATAAGGSRMFHADAGAGKQSTPLANPTHYFEMTFNAEAGRPYRLWIRGKAQNDYWGNDSIFVQFLGSVTSNGTPIYRIGTTSGADINLEDCSGCGLQGWGWQDNGWGVGVMGPLIYFQTTGLQTLRVQTREDGVSIDQIVLSPNTFLNVSPGALRNDTVILPRTGVTPPPPPPPPPANVPPQVSITASPTSGTAPLATTFSSTASDSDGYIASYSWTFGDGQTSTQPFPTNIFQSAGTFTARLTVTDNQGATATTSTNISVLAPPPPPATPSNIVIWASDVPTSSIFGNWSRGFNGSAAGQTALRHPDAGAGKLSAPLANPSNYFEMSFNAVAGAPYHLWVRGRADNDHWSNDSIYIQFSGSVNAVGTAIYRIGTTSGADINLEDCSGCGLQGWGWQDNGWGIGLLGPPIYFATTGPQTLRVQTREDGVSIDQIALSPANFLNLSPGALRNDTVILPSTIGGGTPTPPPPPPPPPANVPPQVSITASPTSGTAPLATTFSSTASDSDGYIASYSWTFGDGQTSTQPFPTNIFQSAGTFTARLTVTDNQGATAAASLVITVNSPAPPPPTSTQLKVLSWNIAFCKGTDAIENVDRTATWIANINPDIAGLCEMPPSLIPLLMNLLNQRTGRTWYSHFAAKYVGCQEGNLIVSKYPFSSTSLRYLSYQRSVAQATINVGGRNINFFATHLDPDSGGIRSIQIGEMNSWASGFAEQRIIVGDLNAGPDWPEIGAMNGSYFDSWTEARNINTATGYPDNPVGIHTRTRRGRIDYIFYSRGASSLVLRSAQVPDSRDLNNRNVVVALGTLDDRGVRPSDHNHMVATFDVR